MVSHRSGEPLFLILQGTSVLTALKGLEYKTGQEPPSWLRRVEPALKEKYKGHNPHELPQVCRI